ncbi:iron uptake transporter permease EfeU [Actinomyces faecalis]|nr:iron uptake transporter permease EfeU [Actinomyces faecalis]
MFIANLLIALREGFEAALIVGIIAAYLVRSGRRDVLPKMWLGVAVAACLPLALGAVLTWGPKTLTFRAQEIIGGSLSLVAVAMVTWMIFWMGRNARMLRKGIEGNLEHALSGSSSGWGVVWIAIISVGREGLETALFIWATVKSSVENHVVATSAGVVVGLVISVVLGWLVYKGAARINMRLFFAVTGYFLILVAAGVVSYAVADFQEAGLLPGIMNHAWDVSDYLPGQSSPVHWLYIVAKAMFQVEVQPTVLQVVAWWLYIVPTLLLFTRQVRGTARRVASAQVPSVPASGADDAAGSRSVVASV